MNKQIKQLEKIAYNLGRVLERVDREDQQRKREQTSYVRGRVANWVRDCVQCEQEFFPTSNKNTRCGRCR